MDDLIKKIAKGDKSAFEKLVSEYQSRIYSLCFGFLSNREDALDITQEVFIKIYRSASSFKSESKLSTWIYSITKNMCIDFLRKQKKYSHQELPNILPDMDTPSPQEIAEKAENRETVRSAVAALPEYHRLVILLREYEGLSYSEIAEILSISEGTVKSRISRARAYLLKILTENMEQ